MNTTTTIEAHRAKLTKLHRAKERLTSVRFRGRRHLPKDTEESVLAEIRQLERQIARERKANLRCWVRIEEIRYPGSGTVELSVWEPSGLFQHSTFFTDALGVHGRIGTRPLPQDIEDMRGGSPERLAAVAAWNEAENREAWLAIVAQHPEAAAGKLINGAIRLEGSAP
jgi:hypothetical protein